MKPLCIDLYCGLGGWSCGFLAEQWTCVGFDIERHVYGEHQYPAQLVLQDVRTLHGSQFKDAAMIVASSPCQEFSYRAMPWKRAKALGPPVLGMELFAQAERIQREASEAAGHHIPMVQENVQGAQKWVGRARWHYGSYYLWGDVPALMPFTVQACRNMKAEDRATKNAGGSWFNIGSPGQTVVGQNPVGRKTAGHANIRDGYSHTRHLTNQAESDAVKHGGDWFSDPSSPGRQGSVKHSAPGPRDNGKGSARFGSGPAARGSKSNARKAASARIAMIPLALAQHIARVYYPDAARAAEEGRT